MIVHSRKRRKRRKMRKAELTTIFALSVVMLGAMVGFAYAESIKPASEIYNYNIPNDGTPIAIALKITGFGSSWTSGQSHTISATTTWGGDGGFTDDLQYRFTGETGVPSNWLSSGGTVEWTDNSDPDFVTLEIKALGPSPAGSKYNIRIDDSWDRGSGRLDIGGCTIRVETIPEFATIAVPVAAILGLLFFFNQRRHTKEGKDKGGKKKK
jgi:hypothetical protein